MNIDIDINLNSQLTDRQKSAIMTIAQNTAVIAGPGSGKTRVLTERICYLIREEKVPTENILALTFTNKAANEMKKRIVKALGQEYSKMNIMTFHKLGLQVLRENGHLIGYSKNFEIADTSSKYSILRELIRKYNIYDTNITEIAQNISFFKNGLDITNADTIKIFEEYQGRLFEMNMVDIDDLILKSIDLLKKNQLLQAFYQNKFRHILIDEFQDINEPQKELIELITNDSTKTFIVGDDDQCIYEWRGSTPQLLKEFTDREDVSVIRLEDNFRSNEEIVNISGGFIKSNLKRIEKIFSSKKKGEEQINNDKIIVKRFSSDSAEANAIANQIIALQKTKEYKNNDFAILVRSQKQSGAIKAALQQNDIPYCEYNEKDMNFMGFIKVLKAIVDLTDSKSLIHAMNFPNVLLGTVSYRKLCELNNWDNENTFTNFEQMSKMNDSFTNNEFFSKRYFVLKELSNIKDGLSIVDIVSRLVDYYKGEDYMCNEQKKNNILIAEQVLDIAKKYSDECGSDNDCDLQEFIDYIQCVLQDEKESIVDAEKVNIMTCHRAKGLEFPVVFIPGVQVGVFPNDFFVHTEADLEQERRLFYVTMTRAIDYLFITCYDNPLYVPLSNSVIKKSFITELSLLNLKKEGNR